MDELRDMINSLTTGFETYVLGSPGSFGPGALSPSSMAPFEPSDSHQPASPPSWSSRSSRDLPLEPSSSSDGEVPASHHVQQHTPPNLSDKAALISALINQVGGVTWGGERCCVHAVN